MTPADDSDLILQAYLDGELDSINALAFEKLLATDTRLAAQRDRIVKLRALVQKHLSLQPISRNLRSRIENSLKLRRSE